MTYDEAAAALGARWSHLNVWKVFYSLGNLLGGAKPRARARAERRVIEAACEEDSGRAAGLTLEALDAVAAREDRSGGKTLLGGAMALLEAGADPGAAVALAGRALGWWGWSLEVHDLLRAAVIQGGSLTPVLPALEATRPKLRAADSLERLRRLLALPDIAAVHGAPVLRALSAFSRSPRPVDGLGDGLALELALTSTRPGLAKHAAELLGRLTPGPPPEGWGSDALALLLELSHDPLPTAPEVAFRTLRWLVSVDAVPGDALTPALERGLALGGWPAQVSMELLRDRVPLEGLGVWEEALDRACDDPTPQARALASGLLTTLLVHQGREALAPKGTTRRPTYAGRAPTPTRAEGYFKAPRCPACGGDAGVDCVYNHVEGNNTYEESTTEWRCGRCQLFFVKRAGY